MTMGGRHSARSRGMRRVVLVGLSVLTGLIVLAGGGAYAAYRYEQGNAGRILPGVTIDGIDVGGMTREQAVIAVSPVADAALHHEIEVTVGDRDWHVTPWELGTRADVEAKVDAALAMGSDLPWYSRAFRRLADRPLEEPLTLAYSTDREDANRFLDVVARAVYVSPSDAAISLEDGELVVEKPVRGEELVTREARSRLLGAIRHEQGAVKLPIARLEPGVGSDDLGKTIVVRLSENRLYLYDGVKVVKTYPVASGAPGYSTPAGTWDIWDKRESPTWVNPAPDGWGKDLPAVIGPGPGNPLGTHALYLDAPGIRIHGTYDSGSIGSYASHGCIRMYLADSQELFGLVDVGTKVHILW